MVRRVVVPLFVVLFSVLIFFQNAEAQILNIEKQRTDADTANIWLGSMSFTLNLRKQNVNVLTFNWATNVAYLSELHNYTFISNINLIKVSGRDVVSDAYSHGRINFMRRKDLSYETFAQHQYDKGRGLEKRVLYGAGLRWKFKKSEKLSMALGPGLMHEEEEWVIPGMPRNEVNTHYGSYIKSTTYLALKWQPNAIYTLDVIGYHQARFNKFFRPRFTGEINFNSKINKHFSFMSRFTAQYDDIPVIPIERVNYALTNGITLRF